VCVCVCVCVCVWCVCVCVIINKIQYIEIVLGPFLGGTLARPAVQYPNLIAADGFFGKNPYALQVTTKIIFILQVSLFLLLIEFCFFPFIGHCDGIVYFHVWIGFIQMVA
jgi:hypothetical protein